jgi:hypothetical protein
MRFFISGFFRLELQALQCFRFDIYFPDFTTSSRYGGPFSSRHDALSGTRDCPDTEDLWDSVRCHRRVTRCAPLLLGMEGGAPLLLGMEGGLTGLHSNK